MKKLFIILAMAFLLVLPLCLAGKSLGNVEVIDWKTKVLTVKDTGVYDGKNLIKEVDKSEIWIDKKVKETYYVDSLVKEDTKVNIELFYEIQPDNITYISHNGKYAKVYTYSDWTWKDNCVLDVCDGGWVLIPNVYLEYALGSNTFTDAISGATWMNDGITLTLTEDTDYTRSGKTFTIINIDYAWRNVTTNYVYDYTTNDLDPIHLNVTEGVSGFFGNISTIFSILFVVVIVSLIGMVIYFISKFGGKEKSINL